MTVDGEVGFTMFAPTQHASAQIVIVGLYPLEVGKSAPSLQ